MKLKFTFLITILFIVNAFAQMPGQQLVQLLSQLHSMQAKFVQNSYDNTGRLLQKSVGVMALQRPGKFRWETKSPSHQLIIADGTNIWIYDADLKQASKKNMSTSSQSTNPASLLSGSTEALQQRFSITKMNKANGDWFELKPITKNDMFEWIQLHFKNNQLIGMILSDNLNQKV